MIIYPDRVKCITLDVLTISPSSPSSYEFLTLCPHCGDEDKPHDQCATTDVTPSSTKFPHLPLLNAPSRRPRHCRTARPSPTAPCVGSRCCLGRCGPCVAALID